MLADFDGFKRSCRAALDYHNMRRKRKNAERALMGDAALGLADGVDAGGGAKRDVKRGESQVKVKHGAIRDSHFLQRKVQPETGQEGKQPGRAMQQPEEQGQEEEMFKPVASLAGGDQTVGMGPAGMLWWMGNEMLQSAGAHQTGGDGGAQNMFKARRQISTGSVGMPVYPEGSMAGMGSPGSSLGRLPLGTFSGLHRVPAFSAGGLPPQWGFQPGMTTMVDSQGVQPAERLPSRGTHVTLGGSHSLPGMYPVQLPLRSKSFSGCSDQSPASESSELRRAGLHGPESKILLGSGSRDGKPLKELWTMPGVRVGPPAPGTEKGRIGFRLGQSMCSRFAPTSGGGGIATLLAWCVCVPSEICITSLEVEDAVHVILCCPQSFCNVVRRAPAAQLGWLAALAKAEQGSSGGAWFSGHAHVQVDQDRAMLFDTSNGTATLVQGGAEGVAAPRQDGVNKGGDSSPPADAAKTPRLEHATLMPRDSNAEGGVLSSFYTIEVTGENLGSGIALVRTGKAIVASAEISSRTDTSFVTKFPAASVSKAGGLTRGLAISLALDKIDPSCPAPPWIMSNAVAVNTVAFGGGDRGA